MRASNAQFVSSFLQWVVKGGVYVVVFLTPLLISSSLFFPYITGKNFLFRIITEIVFVAWAALALVDARFRPRYSPLFAALGIFIVVIGFATALGANPYHSFWSNFERMEGYVTYLHLFAFFIAAAHTLKTKRDWAYVLFVSLASSVFAGLYATCEHFNHAAGQPKTSLERFCTTGSGGGRPFGTFGNAIYLGVYLMFHLFFIAALARATSSGWRVALIVLGFFEAYIFLLASSRGALVGLAAGLAAIAFLIMVFAQKRLYRVTALGGIAALFVFFSFIRFFPTNPIVTNVELFTRLSRVSISELSHEPRVMIWGIALKAFREQPILGWGPENFIIPYAKHYDSNLYGNEPWFDRVHNMFLEWLVAGGVLGLFAYLAIFAAAGMILWRLWRRGEFHAFEISIGVGVLVAYLVQDAFVFDNITTFLFLFSFLAFLHAMGVRSTEYHKAPNGIEPLNGAIALVLGILIIPVLYVVNVKPMRAAGQIVVALQYSQGAQITTKDLVSAFRKVAEYDTFGTTEARERFTDLVAQAAPQSKKIPGFVDLVDAGIQDLEDEYAHQGEVVKYRLFLGKLHSMKASLTGGTGAVEAERYYREATEMAPAYIQSYLGLAEFYLMTNQSDKASDIADQIFNMPDQGLAVSRMLSPVIAIHLIAGDYDKAEKAVLYYKDTYNSPRLSEIFQPGDMRLLVGRAFASSKDLRGRLHFFETFLEQYRSVDAPSVQPEAVATVMVGIAQTHAELGNKVAARQIAGEAARLDPKLEEEVRKFINELGF